MGNFRYLNRPITIVSEIFLMTTYRLIYHTDYLWKMSTLEGTTTYLSPTIMQGGPLK